MIQQAKNVTTLKKSTRRTRVNYYCLLWRCAIRSNSSFVNRAILEPRVLLPPPTPLSLMFRRTLVFFVDPVTATKPISDSNPFSGISTVRGWSICRYSNLCQSSAWPNDPIPKYVRRSLSPFSQTYAHATPIAGSDNADMLLFYSELYWQRIEHP